ncbi:hypothetical protein RUM43_011754, partial [Polyplax serrata]
LDDYVPAGHYTDMDTIFMHKYINFSGFVIHQITKPLRPQQTPGQGVVDLKFKVQVSAPPRKQ